jgi:ABC-2 type transport system ATP-binding protein
LTHSAPLPACSGELTLSARQLARRIGKREIVQDISFSLHRVEVLGLLGHNGAGKSTVLQILSGVLTPDSGEVSVAGIDLLRQPQQAKARLGFLPEHPPLYRELTVDAYLNFAARLRRMTPAQLPAAIAETRRRCGLESVGKRIIATLSKGYQQRVGIAQAIIHQPDVIILDEPTVGLDPAQLREIRTLIRELGDHHSVILSTHLLQEITSVCDRVEVMRQGRLVYSAGRKELDEPELEDRLVELTTEAAP